MKMRSVTPLPTRPTDQISILRSKPSKNLDDSRILNEKDTYSIERITSTPKYYAKSIISAPRQISSKFSPIESLEKNRTKVPIN
jgi:hypothetical protein